MRYVGGGAVAGTVLLAGCAGSEDGGDDTGGSSDTGSTGGSGGSSSLSEIEIILSSTGADTVDPHQSAGIPASSVTTNSYEGLLTRDPTGEVVPALATDWYRVEPGQYRFELREGVQWHEGGELTAEDVQYSIRRIIDDDVDITSDRQGHVIGIEDVEIVDDYTVDLVSDGLNTAIVTSAASYLGIMVLNKEWVESNDLETVSTEMNGTGPYRLVEFVEEEYAVFEPFEEYWGEPPAFEQVTYTGITESSTRVNQLLAGEVQLIETLPPADVSRVADHADLSVTSRPSSRVIHGVMDVTVEPWDSKEFRQAMNYAVNNEEYIENVMQGFGTVSSQPALPEMFGYNPDLDPYPYDPERAADLVDESGHAGVEIELSFGVGRMLLDTEFVTAVAGYIDDLPNVTCTVNELDLSTFGTLWSTNHDPDQMDFFAVGYGHPSYDASQTFQAIVLSERVGRFGKVESDARDDIQNLVDQAARTEDRDDREALLQDAAVIAQEEAVWLFLHQQESVYGIDDAFDWTPRNDELMTTAGSRPAE
ncbi:ABC transporter substrate-binding protein [Natronobiforma cellulositropha]|uniref:ABC transporter substrate-binding protein n=1 Tax=Natronobiforma cellulositropha TaxID=1679076 RepID=UPI0021D5F4A0|nr:ABC transporter substrate-binding protein [Natronobiforma cellulositropha]